MCGVDDTIDVFVQFSYGWFLIVNLFENVGRDLPSRILVYRVV